MKIEITGLQKRESLFTDLSFLFAVWILGIVIVNPVGDFPLNDDWSFASTVKRLFEFGIYVPSDWTAMSLLTNVYWGALFCLPAGFSFNALRASTLVAAIIGGAGVYFGAKELGAARVQRVIAVLILIFNPIYFALSNTFMTDVVFAVLVGVSALFFVRYFKRESTLDLIIASSFAVAATLSRQLGIAIPLAFAVSYFLLNGVGVRSISRGLLPFIVCISVLIFYNHWLSETGRMTVLYSEQNAKLLSLLQHPRALILSELVNGYIVLLYMGLFFLPLLSLYLRLMRERLGRIGASFIFVAAATSIHTHFYSEPKLPLLQNILRPFGLGPLTLKDTYILGASVPQLPAGFWTVVTYFSLFGAALLVFVFLEFLFTLAYEVRQRKITQPTAIALFAWVGVLTYSAVICSSHMFDRYLLPIIPPLGLAVIATLPADKFASNSQLKTAAAVMVVALAFFSVCTTRDYLTWNRMRWQALSELTNQQQVEATAIDGGFEFNGLYLYDSTYIESPGKSWWWVAGDTYLISFNRVPGYTTVKEYPYSHWLPSYEGKVLVLKRARGF